MAPGPGAESRQRARADEPRAPEPAGLTFPSRGRTGPAAPALPVRLVHLALLALLLRASPAAAGQAGADTLRALPGPRVTVFHAPGDSVRAAAYLDLLLGLPALPGLPDSIPSAVRAYLAPDQGTFDSLLGGRAPEWSGGVAIPSRKMLVIPAWKGSLTRPGEARRVLMHEWAHLGLHDWLGELRVPRWFDEGYAEWAAGWTPTEAWRLRLLIAAGRAPSMDSITLSWPSERSEAEAAYLLSATVVEYLVHSSGERGLGLLLARWREVRSFEEALRATYGVTSGQLEEDWSEWVKDRYGWLYVLSHSSVFWGLLALALLLMMRVRRRRNRERLARLRAVEPEERPAWWMEGEGIEDG